MRLLNDRLLPLDVLLNHHTAAVAVATTGNRSQDELGQSLCWRESQSLSEVLHRGVPPPAVRLVGKLPLVLPRGLSEEKWPPNDPTLRWRFSDRVRGVGGCDSDVDHSLSDPESELGRCRRLYLIYCTCRQTVIRCILIFQFSHCANYYSGCVLLCVLVCALTIILCKTWINRYK